MGNKNLLLIIGILLFWLFMKFYGKPVAPYDIANSPNSSGSGKGGGATGGSSGGGGGQGGGGGF